MRVTFDGKRSEVNIGRTVEPDKWNAKSEKMLGRSVEANDLNDYIELMRKKAKDVQKSFVEKSVPITLSKFVQRFKGEEKDNPKWFWKFLKNTMNKWTGFRGKIFLRVCFQLLYRSSLF